MVKTEILSQIWKTEGVHLRELSRLLKVSMPTVEHHVGNLERENLIKKVKEGRNVKLFPNYANANIIPQLYVAEYARFAVLPDKVKGAIFEFLGKLKRKPVLTAIFGSYAKNTFVGGKSDVDLFLVFNKVDGKEIENKSKAVGYKFGVELAPAYVTFEEFSQKFFDENDKFMREIKRNKIVIQGLEWWVILENEK